MKGIEKLIVCLLGLTLLAVGWQAGQGRGTWPPPPARPDFDFLREPGGGQVFENAQYWFRVQSLVMLDGVAGVENLGQGPFRHGLGPATRLVMRTGPEIKKAILALRFYNGVPDQNLVFRYDGQPLETLQNVPTGTLERTIELPLGGGEHEFRLEYERWNHHGIELTAADGRSIAVGFSRLELTLLTP